jgi:hypothetical protein
MSLRLRRICFEFFAALASLGCLGGLHTFLGNRARLNFNLRLVNALRSSVVILAFR